jgi:hypothetical protein
VGCGDSCALIGHTRRVGVGVFVLETSLSHACLLIDQTNPRVLYPKSHSTTQSIRQPTLRTADGAARDQRPLDEDDEFVEDGKQTKTKGVDRLLSDPVEPKTPETREVDEATRVCRSLRSISDFQLSGASSRQRDTDQIQRIR